MQPLAYCAGVVSGDGWLSQRTIGLKCKDKEFADAFSDALEAATGVRVVPAFVAGRYWLVRAKAGRDRFASVGAFRPRTSEEHGMWLRGMFDSDGSVGLRRSTISENAYGRFVGIFKTDMAIIERVCASLAVLGVAHYVRLRPHTAGHLGTKPVYVVILRGGRENYQRFAALVGSSIPRKRRTLEAIPGSYRQDRVAHCRAAQAKGVAVRLARKAAGGRY
jgi:hypothetical protein